MSIASNTLFMAPGACSRVAMVALEEAGLTYTPRKLALMQGEQRQASYLALNPKGKVPLLVTAQGRLSENIAIVQWLDAMNPDAALLPAATGNPWQRAQGCAWLSWCASTLHPMIYRVRMTARIHPQADTHETIRQAALGEFAQQLAVAEEALADGRPWLMGSAWCAADMYLTWAYGRAVDSGLAVDVAPRTAALAQRQMARPAFARMQAQEAAAQ